MILKCMKFVLASAIVLLWFVSDCFAQIHPLDGDTLNYTSVVFQFPVARQGDQYQVQLEELGGKKIQYHYDFKTNKGVIQHLTFGKSYRWRYAVAGKAERVEAWSSYSSFHIGTSPLVNPELYSYKGKRTKRGNGVPGVFFVDYGRVAVNRAGAPLFFLPDFPFIREQTLVRDLKMTPNGTLTALFDSAAYEFNLDGEILWKAPDSGKINGEKRENYHHEFTKLPTGNYLVLGIDHVKRITPEGDSVDVEFGTVIEYASDGSVAWSWNSNDYFTDQDLFSRKDRNNRYDTRTHMNACTTNGTYYFIGFRDISRIVVVEKSTGKAVASYGGYGKPIEPHSGTGFFRRQHDAQLLSDGNLAVINNDSVMDPSVVSSFVVFSQGNTKQNPSVKLFEFKFNFDTLTNGKSPKTGNLIEMPDGNIVINMGSINRCVEITRKGELIWDMFMTQYDTLRKIWRPFPSYRVSYESSLYPYLFHATAQESASKKYPGKRLVTVKLFNLGSEEDTYTVALINTRTGKVITSGKRTLAGDETKDISFNYQVGEKMKIRVTGVHAATSYIIDL